MRLPFVSRLAYEAKCDALSAEMERCDMAMNRYDTLLRMYSELRSAGANPQAVGLKPLPEPKEKSDLAIEDVLQRRGGSIALRRVLQRFQSEQRALNVDEDEIAHRISYWSDPDEERAD